MACIK